MCGIWLQIQKGKFSKILKRCDSFTECEKTFYRFKPRGPDHSYFQQVNKDAVIGFHRLAIMDPTPEGNQPFYFHDSATHTQYWAICNGEIYNWEALKKELESSYKFHSNSDCEVLIPLYKKYGFPKMLSYLDGVYAICIIKETDTIEGPQTVVHTARDPFGVRPMFYSKLDSGFAFCSELKGLAGLYYNAQQFPCGMNLTYQVDTGKIEWNRHYEIEYPRLDVTESIILKGIRDTLTSAVKKRLHADRPIGALLSGGLDSSIIAALVVRMLREEGSTTPLSTFCIGMKGGTDFKYARMVADKIGSDHTEVIKTQDDFLKAIPKVIEAIESYDITTVRASVGQYLISQYVKETTEIKVLF